jgi:spermidine/putrescine transport system permease protein
MTSRFILQLMLGFYLVLFFAFLFGPLAIMGVTAFNTPSYPQAWPFEGFTLEWFGKLFADRNLIEGLGNSVIIGLAVVALSVPLGLAGAIVMTQVYARARGFYYLVVVSPVLTPGVIIGISTVIFWKDVTQWTGMSSLFDGMLLATLGQSTFISAYCMLMFLSRLQRYDRAQEEAALDLGASRTRVFFDILLPFLRPAIFSAAVIAFLTSFENYNTTTFAILANKTLTTVLAGRVRQGMTPAISALAVIIIAITVAGAIVYEIVKSAEMRREERQARAGVGRPSASRIQTAHPNDFASNMST